LVQIPELLRLNVNQAEHESKFLQLH